MSELVVASLKVAFLALMWIFILLAASVIRTDLFGRQVSTADGPMAAPSQRQPVKPPKNSPASLRVVQGSQTDLVIPLKGAVTIGRAADSTLLIDDDYSSTRHAQITHDDDGSWWIEDLGSTNGTAVNTQLISQRTRLSVGDTVRIGRTHLRAEKK